MREDLDTVAKRLKKARLDKGWSQGQLGAEAGVAQSTIGNIEASLRISRGSLPQIAEALGVTLHWLRDGVGDPKPIDAVHQEEAVGETDFAMLSAFRDMSDEDREAMLKEALERAERFRRLTAEALRRASGGQAVAAKSFEPTKPVPQKTGFRYIKKNTTPRKVPAAKKAKGGA